MGRQPCCDKVGLKKGPWTAEEDRKLINFILTHGQCCWRAVPKLAGLLRCGKSCRLRWTNYLRPDLKRGLLSEAEEKLVIDLHAQLGNRWSKIASEMPGRTDNEIKNHWNTHIKKKLRKLGIDPITHQPLSPPTTTDNHQEHEQDQVTEPEPEHQSSSRNISTNNNDPVNNIVSPESGTDTASSSLSQSISSSSTTLDDDLQSAITKLANQLDVPDYNDVDGDSMMVLNYDGFCIDEEVVPVSLVELGGQIFSNDGGDNIDNYYSGELSPSALCSTSSSCANNYNYDTTSGRSDDNSSNNTVTTNTVVLEAAEEDCWWAHEDKIMGFWADGDLGCWDLPMNDEINSEIQMMAASLESCLGEEDCSTSWTCI